jgi:type I restriction enzyme R subunit
MPSIDFSEEFAAKIPALTLLANLGYKYLTPQQCSEMRTSNNKVMLTDVLTKFLQQQQVSARGKTFKLSDNNITKIINDFNNFAIKDGLINTNKKIYEKLVYGHGIVQIVDGQKVEATIKLIDWDNPENNEYHVTEEMAVAANTETRIPDIVCFVNGLPLVVIEAKKPIAKNTKTTRIDESISQQIRNQKPKEIPQLFIFSQLLLAIYILNFKIRVFYL